jgi:agmatinase
MDHWFLDSEFPNSEAHNAAFHVIPFPLEETVSYMGGTSEGPKALIEASSQLEQLVEGYANPGKLGIHTTQAIDCSASAQEALDEASQRMLAAGKLGSVPVLLGGEHSVTNAAIPFLKEHYAHQEVGFLQFDAHMDLRDSYEGSKLSHASVMHRVVEAGFPLFQIGIRNYSEEDLEARDRFKVGHLDASALYKSKLDGSFLSLSLPPKFPRKLYITFDVDGFDPGLMSATGTPDPGGLTWWDAINLLEQLTLGRSIVGFDVVELAASVLHHPAYTGAKLTYFMMGLAAERNAKCT